MTKKLTLTFDNGPDPVGTQRVLDCLKARGLLANFFPIGNKIMLPGARALLASIRRDGHRIGIHTLSHSLPLGLGAPGFATHEIAEGQALLGTYTEHPPLFRPYAGKGILGPHVLNQEGMDYLVQSGYSLVLWNSVPRDWELPENAWVARALEDIERQDWTVVVLHDARPQAMQYLGEFLDEVVRRGVQIVQQIPDSCMPLQGGHLVYPLADIVAPPGTSV